MLVRNSTMSSNKFFVNFKMVIAIVFYTITITIICFRIIFELETGLVLVETEKDKLMMEIFFAILLLLHNTLVYVFLIPRWFTIIEFCENGLYCYKIFHKKTFIPYSNFREITVATYKHICTFPKYIVFSKRKLSKYEKTHINLISDDVIMLRYGKKILKTIDMYHLACTED